MPASGSPKAKPKLVVLVVIDQWPSWAFEKQRTLFTGGIKRLIDEGAVVPEAELPYGNPFTAPGHAVLATGAVPHVNGIVGNSWWRRGEQRERPAEYGNGEASEHGLGAAFPHAMEKSDHPEHAIVETPFADRVVSRTVAVAIDAMELGRDDAPDFLAISYSAHDYAGHNWGPDSWEVLDDTLRLDTELGELFES